MAFASKETVFREVTTTVEDEEVVLRLSKDEAEVLRVMVGKTWFHGPPEESDWKHSEAIRSALIGAKVPYNSDRAGNVTGSLAFH